MIVQAMLVDILIIVVKTHGKRRMWNIELDRHRDIMRAEAEAQALRQKQDFEARNPKKQAGI